MAALFGRTAQQYATRSALQDDALELTFGELDALSRRAAAGFSACGIVAGDVIAYQLPNWWEAVVVFLAAMRLGATVNPLLPAFRESELRFTLRQSGARLLVIPGELRGVDHRALITSVRAQLPALQTVVVARHAAAPGMHALEQVMQASPTRTDDNTEPINPDAIALLMYTSGTTAAPKGVLHTHNSLAAEIMSLQRVHALTPDDRTLMPSPLTHISGVIHGILTPALLGTSAVLMPRWEPAQALQLIARERVSYMVGAPTFLQDMLNAYDATRDAPLDFSGFRLFSCGGADVSAELMRKARQHFPQCVAKRVYGSTEFPTITTTAAGDATTRGIDSEGKAIWPAEVRIAGASEVVLPAGHEGEVQARGPECCAGYLDESLNRDTFTADGWFRTGDLGVLDADGYLRITGRLKEIVIRKGEKISVKEMEELISAHPAVQEVVVVAIADAVSGERACAVVRLHVDATLSLMELCQFLDGCGVAKQKWPEQLELVSDFPRTESGKIQRAQVKERLRARPGAP